MAFTWTDGTITPSTTPIRKVHIDELRTNYKAVEGAVTFNPVVSTTFSDPTIEAGLSPIKPTHVSELRAAVNNLESKFSNNCNCTNCCQTQCTCQTLTCQSCQRQCTIPSCSCFPAGTQILMHDWTWKNIEDIVIGDYVIGVDGKPIKVLVAYRTILGPTRAIFQFQDDTLHFTGEHPLWVRKDGVQWWGVRDIHQFRIEESQEPFSRARSGVMMNVGHYQKEPLILVGGEEFAHIDGWKREWPIISKMNDRLHPPDFPLYMVVTEKSHTMIANGYLVSAFASDTNIEEYDHLTTDWKGLVNPNA